jgi:hypothetical protein
MTACSLSHLIICTESFPDDFLAFVLKHAFVLSTEVAALSIYYMYVYIYIYREALYVLMLQKNTASLCLSLSFLLVCDEKNIVAFNDSVCFLSMGSYRTLNLPSCGSSCFCVRFVWYLSDCSPGGASLSPPFFECSIVSIIVAWKLEPWGSARSSCHQKPRRASRKCRKSAK